jgi:Transposase DDE domain
VAAAGRHPGPLRRLAGDRQAQRPGRWAGYGYDRSHSRWYWGLKLYVLASPDGLPVAWCLANPTTGEREVAEGLLDQAARQRILRPGMVVVADKGLAGRAFAQQVAELAVRLVRPDRADEPFRFGSLGGVRQWIEAIIDILKDQLGLERHGAHTIQGVWIRVAQRLLALASAVWFNWQLGAPVKRSLVAYDH